MARPVPLLAIITVLMLAVAGCAGPSTSTGAVDRADSPLSEYLGGVYGTGDEEDWQKKAIEQSKKTEDLVATCMSEEGFEYIPAPQTEASFLGSEQEWDTDAKEWVAQYGYGAVNWPGQDEQPDPEDQPQDPNQDYVTSLSQSEQEAFYETLYGPQPTEEELGDDGSWQPTWEQQGCQGWAQHELNGDDPMQSEEHKPVMDAMQKFWESSATAPELAELDAAWADCMAGEGHSEFTRQSEAQQSIYDELNEYYEGQTEYLEDDPKLDDIAEKEVELALADLSCREQTDYRAQAQEVQFALEEQFIDDYKSELEALKADAEKSRS